MGKEGISLERASKKEQNSTNLSSVAPSSEELLVRKQKPWAIAFGGIFFWSEVLNKLPHLSCSGGPGTAAF